MSGLGLGLVVTALAIAACGGASPTCPKESRVAPQPATTTEASIETTSPQEAALAREYQPTVRMTVLDRFWPVSVKSVLAERDATGAGVTLISKRTTLTRPPTLADLRPSDDASAYLAYPALLSDKVAQMRAFLRGLGLSRAIIDAWPAGMSSVEPKTAQIYFFDAGTGCSYPGADTTHYRALEYWFFYALNYYPLTVDTTTMLENPLKADGADVDFHEGDWEHITVLLDPATGNTPKYVWMARHSSEGTLIPWDQLERDSTGHPVVYPAFGGHPSYPDCGAHGRALLAAAVYDYVVCNTGLTTFPASSTRLVDLAKVAWSCWPGYFGTTEGTSKSTNADDPTGQILVAGPRSPLLQGENKNVCPPSSG